MERKSAGLEARRVLLMSDGIYTSYPPTHDNTLLHDNGVHGAHTERA